MKMKFYQALACFAVVVLTIGCQFAFARPVTKSVLIGATATNTVTNTATNTTEDIAYYLKDARDQLERVEEQQNYFGKIAVSQMAFVPNKGQFNINYNEDVSNYVQAARNNISGEASSSVQTALYLGALLQGSSVPISAGSSTGSNSAPGQLSLPNQAETAVNGFPAPPSLNLNPATDERDAVEKGINDKLAEEFLRFMSNPEVDSNQYAVVFGVMQATCQPGQHTRKGFIAELDVSLKYGRKNDLPIYTTNKNFLNVVLEPGFDVDNNRIIMVRPSNTNVTTNSPSQPPPFQDENSNRVYAVENTNTNFFQINQKVYPSVLAVLPLMDSRNMELENNNQSQLEVAEALSAEFAAKGMTAAANMLADYVKRQQSNIHTRNSFPVATTYADGADFGFQLYPSVEAIENPGKSGSTSGDVLEPVTFPLVVAIKVRRDQVKDTSPRWSYLHTEIQTRWIPFHPNFWMRMSKYARPIVWDSYFLNFPLKQRVKRGEEFDQAVKDLKQISPHGAEYPQTIPDDIYFEYQQLQIALDSLQSSALSEESDRLLPDANELFPSNQSDTSAPTITDVYPHTIWRDTNTVLTILVKGTLNSTDVSDVLIGGVSCPLTNAVQYVSHTVAGDSGTTNLALEAILPPYFYSITNSVTNNVDFVVVFGGNHPPATKTVGMLLEGKSMPEANVAISRDVNGKLLGLDIKPGQNVTEQQLLDAINKVLQKSEPPPKTVNIIH